MYKIYKEIYLNIRENDEFQIKKVVSVLVKN